MNKYAALTPDILNIIKNKNTEKPFSGKYCEKKINGSYLCRGCGAVLFRADNQFHSGCGWPSFDGSIKNHVKEIPDADGRRTEIVCAECNAHLGHVFTGENFTKKNTRHCVNSLSIEFVADKNILKTDEVIVAGGCFWGMQYLFQQYLGVLLTEVGYTDGVTQNPTYQQVCSHTTNHVEAMRIVFDVEKISYENIIKYFFEIHDPTQSDGQGPDIGSQYLSRIFYFNESQKNIAEKLKKELTARGLKIATEIKPVKTFWPAEDYHQDYYKKNNQAPYCHSRVKRF
ncbi:MAG TPA: bifunctional methionine sulfoxide reductase B/A protein [Coxiellaceae bacterium]|nr:MAG: peptide-methionine (S)-S-oxide reductase [Gammaproteobacteria bacterium RIFCSPHIGHO2_12_FULL_36_30]HLB56172.1 bifunctional methionine sulfoxide reductase B/A protein [Coxiellaceae bacterium]